MVVIANTPYSGLAIARSLGRLGVPVHGVHPVPHSAAARSRYWRSSRVWDLACAPEQQSLQWLLELGQELGQRPLLVCTDDRSSLFVADHAKALRSAFRFPAQTPGLAHALSSKQQLFHLCTQHGIPTAHTHFPCSREDVLRYAARGPFPVMLKGVDTQALWRRVGVRMRRVEDARTLLSLYEQWETPHAPNLMLQEYVPGGCDRIWMLSAYYGAQGRRLFGMSARKLREYPAYRGVTCLGVCEHNPAVLALCERFMGAVGYRGILDLDFKLDERTGEYKALDANPRIGANFRLFVDAQGNDVIRACYRDLTGQPVPAPQPNDGRKWMVEDFDCVASLRYLRDGQLGAGTGWPVRSR